mgnify:CR=1 FL=1
MDANQKSSRRSLRSRVLTKKSATAALSLALFAGCSSDPGTDVVPAFNASEQTAAQNIVQNEQPSTWTRFKNFVAGSTTDAGPVEQSMAPELSLANQAEPSANLYTRLAQVNEQSGNSAAAVENYRRALKQDPRHLDAVMGLARLYDRDGDFATATTLYLQAVALDPENASVQNDLGLCFARQSRFEEAESALQKAVIAEPSGQLYRNNLATVQVELRKYDAALENLKATHPPEVAEYNLGYLLSQKQDHMQARLHFQNALQLKPQFTEARTALAALGGPVPNTASDTTPRYPAQPQQSAPAGPRFGDRYPNYPQAGSNQQ